MKMACRSSLDRISDLPDCIAENILIRLPIIEAVKTSILSRKWWHLWENLPQLVFDDSFVTKSLINPRDIVTKILEILLLHQGPIVKFTLHIYNLESCTEIDKMIRFLSKNGIQDFYLCMTADQYKMPSYIFSCLEMTQMNHLHLCYCEIKLPRNFKGFSKLISLELLEIVFPTYFHISNCPLLERLKLNTSSVIKTLSIDAPRMQSIGFKGVIKCISLLNTPLVEELSFGIEGHEGDPTFDLVKIFGWLPLIEHLHLDSTFLMLLARRNAPKKLPTLLNSLRVLKLTTIWFTDGLSSILCLLRSSPYLEKLSIEMDADGDEHEHGVEHEDEHESALYHLGMQKYCDDICLGKLREVKINLVRGVRPEIDFIEFLLAKSPTLEKMHIGPATVDIYKCFKMLEEFTRFRRASPKAEIIFPCFDLGQEDWDICN